MAFGFLNGLMLLGLAAVGLPVLAHLISKRRYHVVHWGAMRFLELGQRTRRRIRLQDLLLLMLRMGLLACLALALARPWGSGAIFSSMANDVRHDLVFVLDGSGSMAWQGAGQTPHQQGVQWIHNALEELEAGDTVALIDARQQPRRVIVPPTTDWKRVRESLSNLPEPSGSSQLPESIEDALRILSTTSNISRRVVVLADDQVLAWRPDDSYAWARVDEVRRQMRFSPRIDIVTLGSLEQKRENFSVGPIELSRTATVPEFPIHLRARIRQSGGEPATRRVYFEIDGQRLPEKTIDVSLLPGAEALVEFDHAFPSQGSFVASVVLDPDSLPQDDHSDAVMVITTAIPVLLVDGDSRVDETRSETFYVRSVFSASDEKSPWIQTSVVSPDELSDATLRGQQAVFLCNVARLPERQWESLRTFVRDGGGLVIAPGERIDAAAWNNADPAELPPLLPARFQEIQKENPEQADAAGIDSLTLQADWLQRFRKENGVDFTQVRFSRWWKLAPIDPSPSATDGTPGDGDSAIMLSGSDVQARMNNADPLIVSRSFGHGKVVELAFPLDADWSTLPAKNDFVPFLHELVFMLTASGYQRNVDVGSPLLLPLRDGKSSTDFLVSGPGFEDQPAELSQRGRNVFAAYRETTVPGLYRFSRKDAEESEPFVVHDDGRESDLTPLTPADWNTLGEDDRLTRVETPQQVTKVTQAESPRSELWWPILLVVLMLLVCEAALTRKMVQGGHAALDSGLE
jgi:hypothetical protein